MKLLPFKPRMHVFICTNDRSCKPHNTIPSCAPTITKDDVNKLKLYIRNLGLTNQVYITKASCLGFCNKEGGVIAIWPQGNFYSGITSLEQIKQLIEKEYNSLL